MVKGCFGVQDDILPCVVLLGLDRQTSLDIVLSALLGDYGFLVERMRAFEGLLLDGLDGAASHY